MKRRIPKRRDENTTVTFSCTKQFKHLLESAAQADQRTLSNYIVKKLSEYIETVPTRYSHSSESIGSEPVDAAAEPKIPYKATPAPKPHHKRKIKPEGDPYNGPH